MSDWMKWSRRRVALMFLILGVVEMLAPIGRYVVGDAPLSTDVREVWRPLAAEVLAGGDLYLVAWDNKPPVFQFINLGMELTGHYALSWFLFLGVVHGLTAIALWQWLARSGHRRAGIFAGAVLLLANPVRYGIEIQPYSLAAGSVLAALLIRRSSIAGASLAAGTLCSQYAAFSAPLLLWRRYRGRGVGGVTWFVIGGGVTVLSVFAVVAVLWGPDSAVAGLRLSLGAAPEYVSDRTGRADTLAGAPVTWLFRSLLRVTENGLFLGLAALGTIAGWQYGARDIVTHSGALVFLLWLPTLIRPVPQYWLLPLPFFSALAGQIMVRQVNLNHKD